MLSSSGVAERLSSSSAHASSAATASSSSTTTNTTNTTTYHNNDSDSITTSAASSTRSVILSASTTTTSNSASTPPRSGLGCLADKSNGLMSCQPEAVLRVLDPCKHQLMITASGSFWTCVSGQEAVDIVHNMLAITMQQEDEINAEYESSRVHALSSKQAAMHASVADRYTPRSLVATAAARYLADMAMERQKMNGSFNQIGMFDQIGQSQGQGEGDVSVVVSLLQWR